MPDIHINAVDDPRISVYRDLPKQILAAGSGRFIAEGKHLVDRLLDSDFAVESILVETGRRADVRRPEAEDVPVFVVGKPLIREIVGFPFHRGLLACGLRKPYPALTEIVPPPHEAATLVVMSQIRDPENVGAIVRASAAFAADAVVLGPRCADPFSRRVLRVSMGAVWKVPMTQSDDLRRDIVWLQNRARIDVVATVLDDHADPLLGASRSKRTALLFGSEGHGLDPDLVSCCRRRVTIPMQRGTDSLNAAMAAGIFLHHFTQVRLPDARGAE